MIQWVYEQTAKVYTDVFVATDDKRIVDVVESFGGKAIMTDINHTDGTSRVAEAYQKSGLKADYIVNIQGDEPMISPRMLQDLNEALVLGDADVATLISPVQSEEELFNSSEVFVVTDKNDFAMYFSRAIIPGFKDKPQRDWFKSHQYYKHLGLYAYKASIIEDLIKLEPGVYGDIEGLEQLNWLESGYKVKTAVSLELSIPVDVPADLERVRELMRDTN